MMDAALGSLSVFIKTVRLVEMGVQCEIGEVNFAISCSKGGVLTERIGEDRGWMMAC